MSMEGFVLVRGRCLVVVGSPSLQGCGKFELTKGIHVVKACLTLVQCGE